MNTERVLTISISTRNRLESLTRCVSSLVAVKDLVREVIVVDDRSDVALEGPLRTNLGEDFPLRLKVIRQGSNQGYIVARNRIAREATGGFVLNLDDDAFIFDSRAVRQALDILLRDDRVGVVAFAQADTTGEAWPRAMQPSPVEYACYAPSFIGFAHLLRRDLFVSLGGYRDSFYFYGEEKEYCLRLLDAGYDVVYLPDALVAHVPDPAGRDSRKYLRYTVRNNCLGAIYNEPLPLVLVSVPARLLAYFKMRRGWKIDDPGGFAWVLKQVWGVLPEVLSERRSLSWKTFRRWRQIRQSWPPYPVNSITEG